MEMYKDATLHTRSSRREKNNNNKDNLIWQGTTCDVGSTAGNEHGRTPLVGHPLTGMRHIWCFTCLLTLYRNSVARKWGNVPSFTLRFPIITLCYMQHFRQCKL